MTAHLIAARGLPANPVDAARVFASEMAPEVREKAASGCIIIFDHADHTHAKWRLAMVQELAREATPARINAVVGNDGEGIAQVQTYLDGAPGITGQVFTLAG